MVIGKNKKKMVWDTIKFDQNTGDLIVLSNNECKLSDNAVVKVNFDHHSRILSIVKENGKIRVVPLA